MNKVSKESGALIGKIEKGIPMPTGGRTGPRSGVGRVMELLNVGESFVTDKNVNTLHSHARYYGKKIAYRSVGNGKIRVWRLK